jgi:hypothetical protein
MSRRRGRDSRPIQDVDATSEWIEVERRRLHENIRAERMQHARERQPEERRADERTSDEGMRARTTNEKAVQEFASKHEVDHALEVFDGWLYRLISAYRDRWGTVPRGLGDFEKPKLDVLVTEAKERRPQRGER